MLVGVDAVTGKKRYATKSCLVFATDVEMLTPCYPDSVSRRFRRACERAGVVTYRPVTSDDPLFECA